MFLFLRDFTTTVKSTTANGVHESRKTLVPRLAILLLNVRLAPSSQRYHGHQGGRPHGQAHTVSAARSLWALRTSTAIHKS